MSHSMDRELPFKKLKTQIERDFGTSVSQQVLRARSIGKLKITN